MSFYINQHAHQCPWYPYSELFGAPNVNWCEETLCHWISEPANTYSNVAYLVVAILLSLFALKKSHKDTDVIIKLTFLLGIASGFYHMSLNYLGQFLDLGFIFLLTFWMISLNIKKIKVDMTYKDQWKFTLIGSGLFLIIMQVMYFTNVYFQPLVGVGVLLLLWSEFKTRKLNKTKIKYHFLCASVVTILAGQTFSALDLERVYCDPSNHLFNGHSIWHILSAISIGLIFFHWHQQIDIKKNEAHEIEEVEDIQVEDEATDFVEMKVISEITQVEKVQTEEHIKSEPIQESLNTGENDNISDDDDSQLDLFKDSDK